jgi:murein DD-endopeptidase MepM/ murein hydrolase activator NlpD
MNCMSALLPTGHFPPASRLNRSAGLCVGTVIALALGVAQPAPALQPSAPAQTGAGAAAASVHDARRSGASAPTKARRFWVKDHHFYFSKWYAGRHRKMIDFGCTRAPYYPPSSLCTHRRGFHHGIDIAMHCGTKLFAGLRGTVVRPDSPGALGSAYGPYAFRLRNHRLDLDFVIGHVLHVYVKPGDHVAKGALIARASDQGAPDGCHLHFEVRPKGGSYEDAIRPNAYLDLRRAP